MRETQALKEAPKEIGFVVWLRFSDWGTGECEEIYGHNSRKEGREKACVQSGFCFRGGKKKWDKTLPIMPASLNKLPVWLTEHVLDRVCAGCDSPRASLDGLYHAQWQLAALSQTCATTSGGMEGRTRGKRQKKLELELGRVSDTRVNAHGVGVARSYKGCLV